MAEKVIAIKVDLQGTEAQRKKIARLETEVKKLTNRRTQLNKAQKNGTISLKKYGQEIAKVNTGLKSHRRQLLVTRQEMLGIDGFTTRLGKSFRKMGSSIVAGFAGLFAVQQVFQIIKDGIEVVQKFEQQMANVKAITGATATEFKLLTKEAKNLGSTTIFTATQVGQLQEELSKLGFSTSEILASSEAILQLAQATGSDLAEASVVAGATLRGFGLEASDMQTVVDVMAKSFTSSALDIEKFKESMKLVAPIAKTTETSLQDASAALSILADRGVSGSLAGTQLRKIMADLATKTGVSFQESLQITQDRLAKATSSSEKLAIAKELVGERAKGSLIALAENREELIGLSVEYQNAAGSAEEMAEIMADTSEGASKRFSSAWEGMLLDIDDGNADALKNVKNWAADMLNTFAKVNKDINKLREVGGGSAINFFGGTNEEQEQLLKVMNANEAFLKRNIDNSEAIAKATVKTGEQLLGLTERIKKARKEGDDDLADSLDALARVQIKHFNQLKQVGEDLAKEEKVKAHKELIALEKAEEEKVKVLTEAEKKAQEKAAKEQQKAEDKLSKMIVKLKQNQLILEIDDKREAEFMKLDIAKQNAIAEIELTKATEETKAKARLAIDDKFLAQENALKAKYDAEDKKAQEKIDAKEKEKSDKEKEKETADKLELREKQLQFAQETADLLAEVTSARVTRQKDLALAGLDAQLQQGLINQQQFDKQREDIERKAFQQQKKIDIASALANGAIAITKTVAQLGGVGAITPMGIASLGLVAAQTAAQVGIIAGQSFDKGGYTGSGFGSADSSGFKQAGVVHEGEYVVPKNVLESQRGSSLVGALEAMRTSRPQPFSNIGFANGGFAGASGVDITGLRNEISQAVASSIGSIQVINNATDTITQAAKVNNIQSEATFG